MKDTSRIITGILLILVGIALNSVPLFVKESYYTLISGTLFLIFGVIILINKKEDKIEEVKRKWARK